MNSTATSRNVDTATSNASFGAFLFVLLIVTTLLFLGGYLYFTSKLTQQNSISPEEVFGGPIPSYLDPRPCLKTNEGTIGQFIYPEKNIKISVVISDIPSATNTSWSADGEVEAFRGYALTKTGPATFNPFVMKFATSQVDFRRVKSSKVVPLPVGHGVLTFEVFEFRDEHYAAAVYNQGSKQFLIFTYSIGDPVDLLAVKRFLDDSPFIRDTISDWQL